MGAKRLSKQEVEKKNRFERNCIHLSNDLNFIHNQKHGEEDDEKEIERDGWWLLQWRNIVFTLEIDTRSLFGLQKNGTLA